MEIITKGWPEDNQVLLYETVMIYVQNPDCTEDREGEPQELRISTRNNGIANFLNIQTKNWSFDDINDLKYIIDDFKRRIGYEDSSDS